ncbi:MAG: hypothetical protein R3B84_10450 [Zavarzinella sp.]
MSPADGCEIAQRYIARLLQERALGKSLPATEVCCRASGDAEHKDYYEPREPHLIEDGWSDDHFLQS